MAGLTLETMRVLVIVAFSSFVTEWLCSLHLEIRYIWKSKFCFLTACFLGARVSSHSILLILQVVLTDQRSNVALVSPRILLSSISQWPIYVSRPEDSTSMLTNTLAELYSLCFHPIRIFSHSALMV